SDLFGGNSSPAEISFYNVRTDKWVKQADIAPPSANTTSTGSAAPGATSTTGSGSITTATSLPETDLPASKSNAAAIGGGVAGVAIVVAFIGFLFFRRHKQAGGSKRAGSQDIPLNGTAVLPGDTTDASQFSIPPTTSSTTYPEPTTPGLHDIYTDPYANASAPAPAQYPPPPSTPYTEASMSPYTVVGSIAPPYRDSLATYVDPSSVYAIQGMPQAEPTITTTVQDKIEKGRAIGNPQTSSSPPPSPFPPSSGGGYADTHGYGGPPIPTSPPVATSSYFPPVATAPYLPPPPPIPSRPQLYNTPPQYQEHEQQQHTQTTPSYNNPQYISPSALALEHEFPQPPPTTRNPQQTHQGTSSSNSSTSNSNNDDNFDSITDPLQKLALIQARQEENMERMRREQQAELDRMRKQIENQNLILLTIPPLVNRRSVGKKQKASNAVIDMVAHQKLPPYTYRSSRNV
ncbi:hypothetical protein BGX33_000117, partial [Mortierella sp. NVP41]